MLNILDGNTITDQERKEIIDNHITNLRNSMLLVICIGTGILILGLFVFINYHSVISKEGLIGQLSGLAITIFTSIYSPLFLVELRTKIAMLKSSIKMNEKTRDEFIQYIHTIVKPK